MKPRSQDLATLPKDLPILAVLGLTQPPEGDWGRLRGLQYASLARVTVARIIAHGIAAIATVQVFLGHIMLLVLIGWFVALCGALYYGARFDRSLENADRRRMSREEVNTQTVSSAIVAVVWTVPILFFSRYGAPDARLQLWTIVAMLMTAISKNPEPDLLTLVNAGLDDDTIGSIQRAIAASLDRSLTLAAQLQVSALGEHDALAEYEIDVTRLGDTERPAS